MDLMFQMHRFIERTSVLASISLADCYLSISEEDWLPAVSGVYLLYCINFVLMP